MRFITVKHHQPFEKILTLLFTNKHKIRRYPSGEDMCPNISFPAPKTAEFSRNPVIHTFFTNFIYHSQMYKKFFQVNNNQRKSKLGATSIHLYYLQADGTVFVVESTLLLFNDLYFDLIKNEFCNFNWRFLLPIQPSCRLIQRDVMAALEITPCGVIITPHRSKNNPINYDFF